MNIRDFLRQVFLFSSFTAKEIELVEAAASFKEINKGGQVFSEGLEAAAFFIVVTGKVKIYKVSSDGKEHTLHFHGPGEPVAEAAIFDSMIVPGLLFRIRGFDVSQDFKRRNFKSHQKTSRAGIKNDERLFKETQTICCKDRGVVVERYQIQACRLSP